MNIDDLPANMQRKVSVDLTVTFEGTPCWQWVGVINHGGYGTVTHLGGTRRAHRVAYEVLQGPIPGGLQIDHRCKVRHCINPAHLEPVTARDNIHRSNLMLTQDECHLGHKMTEENTKISVRTDGRVRRDCVTCIRVRSRAKYERRRSA